MDFKYENGDELVITGGFIQKNLNANKSIYIEREIGQRPVLAFGNSGSDTSMMNYTIDSRNPYPAQAYMIVADDDVREWGTQDWEKKSADYIAKGFIPISMKNDFARIYADGITKAAEQYQEPDWAEEPKAALDAILERGVLRVGTAGDYLPMSYLDPATNTYVGFDAELAEDLAAALGVELEYVETSWPTLMEDTLAGKFDLAICGITITETRQAQALMSVGYLENGKTVLCRAEDADKYTSLEAINRPEVRVMENPGGLNEKFARENLPDATLIIHDVNQEIPGLIAVGEADVMITEIMEAGYYVGQDSRLAAPLIYEPFTQGELGVLMPKGSEDLLAFVNTFLEDKIASGRIDELAEEYIYRYITTDEQLQPAA
jgi:cyclohexadienyl dehydratase